MISEHDFTTTLQRLLSVRGVRTVTTSDVAGALTKAGTKTTDDEVDAFVIMQAGRNPSGSSTTIGHFKVVAKHVDGVFSEYEFSL